MSKKSEAMEALKRIERIVSEIKFRNWQFVVDENPLTLRVIVDGVDNRTGKPITLKGRKWLLKPRMLDGEIVQTAFLAVATAEEHERREGFTFQGEAVFDPHYNIHKLVALHKDPSSILERENHAGQ